MLPRIPGTTRPSRSKSLPFPDTVWNTSTTPICERWNNRRHVPNLAETPRTDSSALLSATVRYRWTCASSERQTGSASRDSGRTTRNSETVPDSIPATVLRLRSSRSALPDAVVPIQIRPTPPLSEMRPLGRRLRSGALWVNIGSPSGSWFRPPRIRGVRVFRTSDCADYGRQPRKRPNLDAGRAYRLI
jgi:hypothetical protein